ncbi:MAG: UDP-glucose 4-epimerase GalE [Bacillota bacterium]
MNILITGGAGYIGSHAVKYFKSLNHNVIVVDNLSTGFSDSIDESISFYNISIHNVEELTNILTKESIEAVIHFAAYSLVNESVKDPLKYYHNNVEGGRSLIKAMINADVDKIIFSSTAAVYGEQLKQPIDENATLNPTNPYGESKWMIEKILNSVSKVSTLKYVTLRYFNVAGAHHDNSIGERHNPETHLIPNLIKSTLKSNKAFTLFGVDHNTPDGTAIRDYIHVEDLVEAHALALDYLIKNKESNYFNLGTENGHSVKEILSMTEKVTGKKIKVNIEDKRPGDPATLIASHQKAKRLLHWQPKRDLKTIIESAYQFHLKEETND